MVKSNTEGAKKQNPHASVHMSRILGAFVPQEQTFPSKLNVKLSHDPRGAKEPMDM